MRLLLVWEPVSLALAAAPLLPTLAWRDFTTTMLLALRVGVVGIGVAAGIALANLRPHGVALAMTALVLSALATASLLRRQLSRAAGRQARPRRWSWR